MLIAYCRPSASLRQAMRACASRCQSSLTSGSIPSASAVSPRQSSMSSRASFEGVTTGRQRASTAVRSDPPIDSVRQARTISASASASRPLVASASASRSDPMPVCGGSASKNANTVSGGIPDGICRSPARRRVCNPGQSGLRSRKSRYSSQFPAPSRSRVQVTRSRTAGLPVWSARPFASSQSPVAVASSASARSAACAVVCAAAGGCPPSQAASIISGKRETSDSMLGPRSTLLLLRHTTIACARSLPRRRARLAGSRIPD